LVGADLRAPQEHRMADAAGDRASGVQDRLDTAPAANPARPRTQLVGRLRRREPVLPADGMNVEAIEVRRPQAGVSQRAADRLHHQPHRVGMEDAARLEGVEYPGDYDFVQWVTAHTLFPC